MNTLLEKSNSINILKLEKLDHGGIIIYRIFAKFPKPYHIVLLYLTKYCPNPDHINYVQLCLNENIKLKEDSLSLIFLQMMIVYKQKSLEKIRESGGLVTQESKRGNVWVKHTPLAPHTFTGSSLARIGQVQAKRQTTTFYSTFLGTPRFTRL